MTKKPAEGVRGVLLYNPIKNYYWFRVYGEADPETGRKPFTDYQLAAEDISVVIESGGLALYDDDKGRRLDWDMERIREAAARAREAGTLSEPRRLAVTVTGTGMRKRIAELEAALREAILHRHKTTRKVIECDPGAGSTYEIDWTPEVKKWAVLCGLELKDGDLFFYSDRT